MTKRKLPNYIDTAAIESRLRWQEIEEQVRQHGRNVANKVEADAYDKNLSPFMNAMLNNFEAVMRRGSSTKDFKYE